MRVFRLPALGLASASQCELQSQLNLGSSQGIAGIRSSWALEFLSAEGLVEIVFAGLLYRKLGESDESISWSTLLITIEFSQLLAVLRHLNALRVKHGMVRVSAQHLADLGYWVKDVSALVMAIARAIIYCLLCRKLDADPELSMMGAVLVPLFVAVPACALIHAKCYRTPQMDVRGFGEMRKAYEAALSSFTENAALIVVAIQIGQKIDGNTAPDYPWLNSFVMIWCILTGGFLLWLISAAIFKVLILPDLEIHLLMQELVGGAISLVNVPRLCLVYFALTLACMVLYTLFFAFVRQTLDEISLHSNAEIFGLYLAAESLRVVLIWLTAILVRIFLVNLQAVATTRREIESGDVEQGSPTPAQLAVSERPEQVTLVRQSSQFFVRQSNPPTQLIVRIASAQLGIDLHHQPHPQASAAAAVRLDAIPLGPDGCTPRTASGGPLCEAAADGSDGPARAGSAVRECTICCSAVQDAVLQPCGHGGFCFGCAKRLFAPPQRGNCPLCRASVHEVLQYDPSSFETDFEGHRFVITHTAAVPVVGTTRSTQ